MTVLRILHISDVHFGPPHLEERSRAVVELEKQRNPDLVVVSGDLTQRERASVTPTNVTSLRTATTRC